MGFLRLLNLRKIVPYVLVALLIVGAYYSGYQSGYDTRDKAAVEQKAEEYEDTTRDIRDALKEYRKGNPTGDAATSLQRLRDRQTRD